MDFMNDTGSYTSGPAKVLFQEKANEHGYEGEFEYGEEGKDGRAVNEEREAATPKTSRGGSELTADSPKFKGMFGGDDKNHKKGYYGPLPFFNTKPVLLPSNPVGSVGNSKVKDKLREYGEQCKLDIYLNLCEQDYVGDDLVDNALNAQEVCRKIGEIKQEWKDGSGRMKMETPDEIFNKYLQLATSLPTNALTWPIQLCSYYFAALTPDLAERMTTDAFRMPSLAMLTTKPKQLEALRAVRRQAASTFKALEEEKTRMTKIMKQMAQQHRGGSARGGSYATSTTDEREVDKLPAQENAVMSYVISNLFEQNLVSFALVWTRLTNPFFTNELTE